MKYLPILLLLIGCSYETEIVTQEEYTGKMELMVTFYQAEVKLDYGGYIQEYKTGVPEIFAVYIRPPYNNYDLDVIQNNGLYYDNKEYIQAACLFRINGDLTKEYKTGDCYLKYTSVMTKKLVLLPYNRKIEISTEIPKVYINGELCTGDADRLFYSKCKIVEKKIQIENVELHSGSIALTVKEGCQFE